jgi:hypothetical protein
MDSCTTSVQSWERDQLSWLALLRVASTLLTILNAVVCIGMVVDFTRLSQGRWRQGPYRAYGVLIVGTIASLGAIFVFIAFSRLLGDSVMRQVIGFLLYLVLSVMLPGWWRLMRRSQARRRSMVDRRKEGGASDGT